MAAVDKGRVVKDLGTLFRASKSKLSFPWLLLVASTQSKGVAHGEPFVPAQRKLPQDDTQPRCSRLLQPLEGSNSDPMQSCVRHARKFNFKCNSERAALAGRL